MEGEEFLQQITTEDGTWVKYVSSESKEVKSIDHSLNKLNNLNFSNQKMMSTVFWGSKGILLIEFMKPGTTINSTDCCETLRKLRRAIQNKIRCMLTISKLWCFCMTMRDHTHKNFSWGVPFFKNKIIHCISTFWK